MPGANSDWKFVNSVVPQCQRPILGRLLFLLYIDDIVENINSSIRLFADDTYIIVDNPVEAANQLNSHPPKYITGQPNDLLNLIKQNRNHE